MDYKVGDIVETKKKHPCGNNKWEITRVGIDFKLKCTKCEHCITLERQKALKIDFSICRLFFIYTFL